MADISLPIRCCLSDLRWDGNHRYPFTTRGYEIDLKISPSAAVFRAVVGPSTGAGEFSTTSVATLPGQEENRRMKPRGELHPERTVTRERPPAGAQVP
jgi:hypothetical protein